MYCYFPEHRFGQDMIAWTTWVVWNPGDLVLIDDRYALIWWEHIQRSDDRQWSYTAVKTELLLPALLSQRTRTDIDQVVCYWLSSYASVLPLRVGSDIVALDKYAQKKKQSLGRSREVFFSESDILSFRACDLTHRQQLIIFPDIWTMHQQLPQKVFDQPWVARWHSGLTSIQKAKIFRWCKSGQIHTLMTTPAWIFQDWCDIWSICLVDAHKWWYKTGHEPRCRIPTVIRYRSKTWNISYTYSWVLLDEL